MEKTERHPRTKRKSVLALRGEEYLNSEFKRQFDQFLGMVGMHLLIPVSNHFAKRVEAEDGGPAYYEEIRVGQNGEEILVRKLRTMPPDAHSDEKRYVTQQDANGDDPRATQIGKFLRKSKIDEIEQLRAVAAGTLALIGPRIFKQASFDRIYEHLISDPNLGEYEGTRCFYDWLFNGYNIARPGLLDLNFIQNSDRASELKRLDNHIEYGRNACLALDLRIIGGTARILALEIAKMAKKRLARSLGFAQNPAPVESKA